MAKFAKRPITYNDKDVKFLTSLGFDAEFAQLLSFKGVTEQNANDYFENNLVGDCLLAVGDDELIKIHFHTNEPWKVLEYCSTLGEIYDIVVEDMDRQSRGLKG